MGVANTKRLTLEDFYFPYEALQIKLVTRHYGYDKHDWRKAKILKSGLVYAWLLAMKHIFNLDNINIEFAFYYDDDMWIELDCDIIDKIIIKNKDSNKKIGYYQFIRSVKKVWVSGYGYDEKWSIGYALRNFQDLKKIIVKRYKSLNEKEREEVDRKINNIGVVYDAIKGLYDYFNRMVRSLTFEFNILFHKLNPIDRDEEEKIQALLLSKKWSIIYNAIHKALGLYENNDKFQEMIKEMIDKGEITESWRKYEEKLKNEFKIVRKMVKREILAKLM